MRLVLICYCYSMQPKVHCKLNVISCFDVGRLTNDFVKLYWKWKKGGKKFSQAARFWIVTWRFALNSKQQPKSDNDAAIAALSFLNDSCKMFIESGFKLRTTHLFAEYWNVYCLSTLISSRHRLLKPDKLKEWSCLFSSSSPVSRLNMHWLSVFAMLYILLSMCPTLSCYHAKA